MHLELAELLAKNTDELKVFKKDTIINSDNEHSEDFELLSLQDTFESAKDDTIYEINDNFRGFCLIFNHIHFENLDVISNYNNDVCDLAQILPEFGYIPRVFHNLSVEKMLQEIDKIRLHNGDKLNTSDSIIIFILTNQKSEGKLLAYDQEYNLFDILHEFSAEMMPELSNKPKLVFIETKWKNGNGLNLLIDQQRSYRIDRNFFIEVGQQTHTATNGSIFTNSFIEIIKTLDLCTHDLMKIVNLTLQKIDEKPSHPSKGCPIVLSTLNKTFYFLNPREAKFQNNIQKKNEWGLLKWLGFGEKYSFVFNVNLLKRMLFWFGPLFSIILIYKCNKMFRIRRV